MHRERNIKRCTRIWMKSWNGGLNRDDVWRMSFMNSVVCIILKSKLQFRYKFFHSCMIHKWRLENSLSHSFIIDLEDCQIMGLFTDEEREEIKSKNIKYDPELDEDVVACLDAFNKVLSVTWKNAFIVQLIDLYLPYRQMCVIFVRWWHSFQHVKVLATLFKRTYRPI